MLPLEQRPPSGIFGGPARPPRKILVVNGHPDPGPERFCAALCEAYADGARSGGADTGRLNTGALTLVGTRFADDGLLESAIGKILWADQLMVIFPLRLDEPPAGLMGLFEQAAYRQGSQTPYAQARTVITMAMPAFAHRALLESSYSVNGLNRRLSLPGAQSRKPVLIGSVRAISASARALWLRSLHGWGTADSEVPRRLFFASAAIPARELDEKEHAGFARH